MGYLRKRRLSTAGAFVLDADVSFYPPPPPGRRSVHFLGLTCSPDRPLRVVHSALCTRVLLNLRKAAARGSRTEVGDFTIQTTVAFAQPGPTDLESRGEGPLPSYDLTELRHQD